MAQRIPKLILPRAPYNALATLAALAFSFPSLKAAAQEALPAPAPAPTAATAPTIAPEPSPAATPNEKPFKPRRGGHARHKGKEGKDQGDDKKRQRPHRERLSREAIDKLPPEERQRFLENLERWKKLPPERRNSLRHKEMGRRQRIEQETTEALKKSGVSLSESQRTYFIERYEVERLELEKVLREEMDEKRRQGVEALSEKLLKEAQAQPVSTAPAGETQEASPQPAAQP